MDHRQCIERAIDFIEKNLKNEFTLRDVANEAFKSLSYMHRIFYFMTGFTLKEYIRNRRLSNAAYLLKCSKQSITDIALDSGYQSVESFTRAFQQKYDLSPRQFRHASQEQLLFERLNLETITFENSLIERDFNLDLDYVVFKNTTLQGFQIQTTIEGGQQAKDICNFANSIFSTGKLNENFNLSMTNIYGVYTNMTDQNEFDYTIGCEQASNIKASNELVTHDIITSKYARFRLDRNDRIKEAWHYIYGTWFLEQVENRTQGFDFEIYFCDHTDIYIPMNHS